ncbi:MAG: helix-turn-helix domain-containing protein [Pseudomonadota bacterium]|jgi:AcrR family transcriptional regulator
MLRKAPKQARSEQMIDCILAGATRVLNTVPLAQTTTNRIAEVAGVSIGSLYQYFDGKDAIAAALLRRHLDETVELLRDTRIASRGCSAKVRLRLPFVEILRDHCDARMLHLNLIRVAETAQPSGELQQCIARMVDEIALALADECPEAGEDAVRLTATLQHRSATLLAHAAVNTPGLARDGVILDHFDALSAANLKALRGPRHARRHLHA